MCSIGTLKLLAPSIAKEPEMRFLLCLMILAVTAFPRASEAAAPTEPMKLWPKGAPNEKGGLPAESDLTKDSDGKIAGKRLIRLGNVSDPTLTVYKPPKEKDTGASVLVCPGGAYFILALDLEGSEVCEWLNGLGVTGILLKYRVPRRPDREPHAAPLEDAQRAMGIIRQHAKEWELDPKRIGVLGFSAGGHLAAALSTNHAKRSYERVDAADDQSCRPDFTVLVYPAYLVGKDGGPELVKEIVVDATTPQAFLVHAQDDPVTVESSLFYYFALKKAKVAAELHVFPTGGHGYGLRKTSEPVTHWADLAGKWLETRGLLKR